MRIFTYSLCTCFSFLPFSLFFLHGCVSIEKGRVTGKTHTHTHTSLSCQFHRQLSVCVFFFCCSLSTQKFFFSFVSSAYFLVVFFFFLLPLCCCYSCPGVVGVMRWCLHVFLSCFPVLVVLAFFFFLFSTPSLVCFFFLTTLSFLVRVTMTMIMIMMFG